VLTTLLKNGLAGHFAPGFDPYFGKNTQSIPDISKQGYADFYTYWFYTRFETPPLADGVRVWLYLRGINYSADIYLNGVQLNGAENIFLDQPQSTGTGLRGMFLRNAFDITELVNKRDGASNASQQLTIKPKQRLTITFPFLTLKSPRLWWPNGYGAQELYSHRAISHNLYL